MKGKRYSTEDKIRILREADRGQKSIQTICQEQNISEVSFHRWRRQFGQMEVQEARRLKELERENRELKQMLADSLLKNRGLEAVCKKNCEPGAPASSGPAGGGRGDMLWAVRGSVFGVGALDVWVSGSPARAEGRTVKETATGAVGATSALWVSADRGAVASGRLAGGQAADSAVTPG
jgi:putative transposase